MNWFRYWNDQFQCCENNCVKQHLWEEKHNLERMISNIKNQEEPSVSRKIKLQDLSYQFKDYVSTYIDENCEESQNKPNPEDEQGDCEENEYRCISTDEWFDYWDELFQWSPDQETYEYFLTQFQTFDDEISNIMKMPDNYERNQIIMETNENFRTYCEDILNDCYE
jgi:hypothetical protein